MSLGVSELCETTPSQQGLYSSNPMPSFISSSSVMWSLMLYHFWRRIFSARVPVCAAMSFLRSPIVSSALHLTRTFFPLV
eukprot:10133_5